LLPAVVAGGGTDIVDPGATAVVAAALVASIAASALKT